MNSSRGTPLKSSEHCLKKREHCRGLDAYGFAHLKACTVYMRCLTSVYADNDPCKFKFGTPKEALSTITRCWEISPSSEEIVKDIEDFPRVLELVVQADGCALPECTLPAELLCDRSQNAIIRTELLIQKYI